MKASERSGRGERAEATHAEPTNGAVDAGRQHEAAHPKDAAGRKAAGRKQAASSAPADPPETVKTAAAKTATPKAVLVKAVSPESAPAKPVKTAPAPAAKPKLEKIVPERLLPEDALAAEVPEAKVDAQNNAKPAAVKPPAAKSVSAKPVAAKQPSAEPTADETTAEITVEMVETVMVKASGFSAPEQEVAPQEPMVVATVAMTATASVVVAEPERRPVEPERRPNVNDRNPPRIPSKAENFVAGDHVVYPTHGVGKVERIAVEEIAGHSLELIHITFEENRMTLRVPVAKARSAGLRKLASRKMFDEALAVLKGRARIKRTMWSRRAQEYEAKINSGDPLSIAEVVRDLHRNAGQPDQSFSERQIYEAAMDRLAAELGALDKTDKATAATKLVNFLKTVA